ncbi:hypothetical protein [Paenibacillus sp. FJAT-26967]|uniref:hypothetical protein n=1 Tax=Paenibacillus sp. FJAT-26967 TaxID=1729690 RepID=UPI0012E33EA1|nr:hypothetical protein [Paenibacillus sp. FJAT-26967]
MFNRKSIGAFISRGFRETEEKKQDFDNKYQQTSDRISNARQKMMERSEKRNITRNK